jgi:hypothetical protein
MKVKKNNRPTPSLPRFEREEVKEPPSPQALIERTRAEALAARNPLAYSMGEPLPGRSALDKIRAQQKMAAEAGDGDNVIALNTRSRGRTDRASPGVFLNGGRIMSAPRDH